MIWPERGGVNLSHDMASRADIADLVLFVQHVDVAGDDAIFFDNHRATGRRMGHLAKVGCATAAKMFGTGDVHE